MSLFWRQGSRTRQALDEMNMPEVHYFIENFLDSFTLTLDELK